VGVEGWCENVGTLRQGFPGGPGPVCPAGSMSAHLRRRGCRREEEMAGLPEGGTPAARLGCLRLWTEPWPSVLGALRGGYSQVPAQPVLGTPTLPGVSHLVLERRCWGRTLQERGMVRKPFLKVVPGP